MYMNNHADAYQKTTTYSYPDPHFFSMVNCFVGSPSDTSFPASTFNKVWTVVKTSHKARSKVETWRMLNKVEIWSKLAREKR